MKVRITEKAWQRERHVSCAGSLLKRPQWIPGARRFLQASHGGDTDLGIWAVFHCSTMTGSRFLVQKEKKLVTLWDASIAGVSPTSYFTMLAPYLLCFILYYFSVSLRFCFLISEMKNLRTSYTAVNKFPCKIFSLFYSPVHCVSFYIKCCQSEGLLGCWLIPLFYSQADNPLQTNSCLLWRPLFYSVSEECVIRWLGEMLHADIPHRILETLKSIFRKKYF